MRTEYILGCKYSLFRNIILIGEMALVIEDAVPLLDFLVVFLEWLLNEN